MAATYAPRGSPLIQTTNLSTTPCSVSLDVGNKSRTRIVHHRQLTPGERGAVNNALILLFCRESGSEDEMAEEL